MPFTRCAVPRKLYRICFGDDPLSFIPPSILADPNRRPGRWDPDDHSYRVLYTADTLENAFKEVIADFRQREDALTLVSAVNVDDAGDATTFDVELAIRDYLEQRSAAVLIVNSDTHVVRIDAPQSCTMISEALELNYTPKGRRIQRFKHRFTTTGIENRTI